MNPKLIPYLQFLRGKIPTAEQAGIEPPCPHHASLKPHQRDICEWAIRGGRRAIFAQFGLGKSRMNLQLAAWVVHHCASLGKTGLAGKFLIVAPLGVRHQFTLEDGPAMGLKIDYVRTKAEAEASPCAILITNYERVRDGDLDPQLFAGASLDEASCFAPGTMVQTPDGYKAIEKFKIGDKITNAYGTDKIQQIHRNEVESFVQINVGGREIITTGDHLFFTRKGWMAAAELQSGDCLVETTEAMRILHEGSASEAIGTCQAKVLQSDLRSELHHGETRLFREDVSLPENSKQGSDELAETEKLQRVRHRVLPKKKRVWRATVLHSKLLRVLADATGRNKSKNLQSRSITSPGKKSKSMVCFRFAIGTTCEGPNQKAESNVKSRVRCQNGKISFRKNILGAWRKWKNDRSTRETSSRLVLPSFGISNFDSTSKGTFSVTSELLQSGLGLSGNQTRNRGRWIYPQAKEVEISRQKENGNFGISRVESVEVLERGNSRLDKFRDADGKLYFYDLGATRHPSYSVEGYLVHNCLRSYGSLTYQSFLDKFAGVPFRYVFTATPSPNKYKELIHYAGFLGVMDTGEALTRFFARDSSQANNLTIYPHMEETFWRWMMTWACFIASPSDLGHDATGYVIPPVKVHWHRLNIDHTAQWDGSHVDGWGQSQLFVDLAGGLKESAKVKRDSIDLRLEKVKEIIAAEPDEHWLIWHDLESERREIEKHIPEAVTVYGSMDLDKREEMIQAFSHGTIPILATKASIAGSGCNFQHHCARAIFMGIGYKFNDLSQAFNRIVRFLQSREVEIHFIYLDTEDLIKAELEAKWRRHESMIATMTALLRKSGLTPDDADILRRTIGVTREEARAA